MEQEQEFEIAVCWSMYGKMKVKAKTRGEAERKAIEEEPLPTDAEYVMDSIFVDEEYEN